MSEVILVVDDDRSVTASINMLLKQNGYRVIQADSAQAALKVLAEQQIDLVLQDMNFSRNTTGEEGLALLSEIKTNYNDTPVILMTAWGSIQLAVDGIKQGAVDFVTKPWDNQQLVKSVATAIELSQPQQPATLSRQELDRKPYFNAIVGEDPKMVQILTTLDRVAKTNASVLILGESGTGKELIADAIHQHSLRSNNELVKVNLGGMSASLFESEMFGHVKGAFTDARQDRIGRFETANGGTIFLDEIGDLDPASQVKLLRVLQDQTYQAVGSSKTRKADVRVVAATNRDLQQMVQDNAFREDLLYRINLITIQLPPLRERAIDIPLIANRYLKKIEPIYGLTNLEIHEDALRWLSQQPWPGNIRQLTQTIERTVLMSDHELLTTDDFIRSNDIENESNSRAIPVGAFTLEEMEQLMIEKSMQAYNGNISKVADVLGLSRAALYRRLEKYGIEQ
jgi:DNA-binding NtrC family response regulator